MAVGTENGSVHLVDLHKRSIKNSLKTQSAVNCVKFLDNTLVMGMENGQIAFLSVPELTILNQIYDSDSSVVSLLPLRNGCLVGKYDGACVWYGFDSNSGKIHEQIVVLTGADVDPITDMAKDHEYVYTSCRDGTIRKYLINSLF